MDPPVLLLLLLFCSGTWAQNSSAHTGTWAQNSSAHTDVDCAVIHLKHVECLWKSPDVNYTFYSRFHGSSFRECDTYIVKENHNVGCRQPEDDLKSRRFNKFETKLEWGEEDRIQEHKLKNRVKLFPPWNLAVQYRSDSNLWLHWQQIYTQCVESEVRYRVNENNWEVSNASIGQDFMIDPPSSPYFYQLQVRSRVSYMCAQSEEWSDWSRPVMWGNRNITGRPQPESLRFTDVQPRRLRASWECNGRQVQRFVLSVYLGYPESQGQRISVLGHERSAEILHLLPNTSYRIIVHAKYSTGFSNPDTGVVTTPQDGVRLSAGPGRCSGSVELLMDGSWSSVCGRDFGLTEAAVVCAELDCGAVSELHQGALFTEGPAVGRSFHCDGAETSLKECESSETRCSAAAHLTCSDKVLRLNGYSCFGSMELRHNDEWRKVMTREDPDLDFGSALCEQMGCGSALKVINQRFFSGPFWRLQPECVKQRSGLTNCLDLDSHMNGTEGGLFLLCSGFYPVVRVSVSSEGASVSSEGASVSSEGASVSSEGASVSSEGASVSSEGASVSSEGAFVSSEGASRVQRVLLMLGTNFSVSCSLDKPFVPGQFLLLSPAGNYTLPSVSHSAHFLFQDFSPAHIGNYTCVFCGTDFIKTCFQSKTLHVTPGGASTLTLVLISICVVIIIIIVSATVLTIYCRRRKARATGGGRGGGGEGGPNTEREYENIRPESERIYQDLRLEEMDPIYSDLHRR